MAIGQLIMHGREHLVGITAHKMELMLVILRYQDELRKPEPCFDKIDPKIDASAVKLDIDLIEQIQASSNLRRCRTNMPARYTSLFKPRSSSVRRKSR